MELCEAFAGGLEDLEGFEGFCQLYWLDRATWDGQVLVTLYLDTTQGLEDCS